MCVRQAERTLAAEQRKADFRPPEDGPPPPLDRPTDACALVSALLSALLRISATHLQGSNLAAFDAEACPPVLSRGPGQNVARSCFAPRDGLRCAALGTAATRLQVISTAAF